MWQQAARINKTKQRKQIYIFRPWADSRPLEQIDRRAGQANVSSGQ